MGVEIFTYNNKEILGVALSTEEILFFGKEELLNAQESEGNKYLVNFKAFKGKISAIKIVFPYMVLVDINGQITVYDLSDIFAENEGH